MSLKTALVNEVIKIILDFLNGPKKLVFVRIYKSTIIGVVAPPYLYCSLVAFCAFAWLRLCAFCAFGAFGAFLCFFVLLVRAKSFRKKKIKNLKLP